MKPWARYEVNFINHDKFRAITANAICLWLEGKNYADDKLSDGLLPVYEVKHWRFYSKKSVALLTTSVGLKPGTEMPYAPLWDVVDGFGYRMHDFLDHNECREKALARMAEKDEQKAVENEATQKRMARWRDLKKAKRDASVTVPVTPLVTVPVTVDVTPCVTPVTPPLRSSSEYRIQNTEVQREKTLSVPASATDLGERAGRLLQCYAVWYRQYRNGATLRLLRNTLEFQDACDLCGYWDDARLEQLAAIVLTTDDPYITGTDRGFRIFALKASWADDRLRQWEAKQQGVTA